ncbi:Hsp33 family molecular chaperone HslO [Alkalihalobacterium sp. APHAB7]|uniref:Hsp33 family molecular chaperone HslO n=1 Tax=Alkalihalobacterium sp. APHAB7 TaxID=3402081 RepID=UPI003AADA3D5
MSDYLVRAIAFDGSVRAYATRTTAMIGEAAKRQDTWPTASAALGRAMTAATMMGAMQKGDAKITVKIEADGPIGHIIVDTNAKGETRGYVKNPHVHFDLNAHGKLDVARAVGTNGQLSIVKDLGLRDYFTGSVPIISGELGEDFTYYFVTSEQIPSAVGVGVLVNPDYSILASGGFILQMMPGAGDDIIEYIEKRLSQIPPISKLIEAGKSPEEILEELLGKENLKILDQMEVKFSCTCSKERFETAIISLGAGEIQAMIDEDGKAETRCHFCNETYVFTRPELETLLTEAGSNK